MLSVADFIFIGSKITVDSDCSHDIKRCFLLKEKKTMTNLDSILKILNFVNKGPYSKASFPSNHVWMWELDGRRLGTKNWCFQTVGLEKNLESPLDCKKIKPVNPKGNQPWIFLGRTVAESEVLILWLFDMMSQLTEKDCDAGQDWGQEEKGATEDEMAGWHHGLYGHEF